MISLDALPGSVGMNRNTAHALASSSRCLRQAVAAPTAPQRRQQRGPLVVQALAASALMGTLPRTARVPMLGSANNISVAPLKQVLPQLPSFPGEASSVQRVSVSLKQPFQHLPRQLCKLSQCQR